MTSALEPAASRTAETFNADELLDLSSANLDALFQGSNPGKVPRGEAAGTIVWAPGTRIARPASRILGATVWRGKVFRAETSDLKNKLGPTGIPAIRAAVYVADSWLDDFPCVVLDYSQASRVAGWIRDEIREVGPGVYLGLVWGVGRLFGGRRLVLRFALTFPSPERGA